MSQAELLTEEAPTPPFQFKNHPIRTQLEGGNLWFAARDVCEALTIKWNGRALSAIPDEWQGLRSFLTPSGNQQLRAILEPAVYKLAFRSNKPEADAFTNWIASEVVPSIRKTGRYEITETAAAPGPDAALPLSTTEDRKPLRALVGSWAQVSGLPFAACWNQLKAAFNLANIKELPQEWIPDAIDWVQKRLDALPAPAPATALPASPSSPADEVEDHLAAIREHIRQIHRHEEVLFLLARRALPPVRKPGDMYSPARRLGLTAFQSMEDCSGALHYNLRALESATHAMLSLDQM
ncbi:BRO family protein [Desulfovibrio piger]|uniref:BRO-N domain-containing protein n=1 Tax=Desulfovibrio piger TaxID=901 RepID=UPI0032C1DDF6